MMKKILVYNWLILAVSSLFTALYITLFEQFWAGKAYWYLLLAAAFAWAFFKQRNTVK